MKISEVKKSPGTAENSQLLTFEIAFKDIE